MFEMSLCCIAERFGEAKGEEFDDASPNPWKWSPARVLRWVRGYKGGKYSAVLEHDALFSSLDGAELCQLDLGTVFLCRSIVLTTFCWHTPASFPLCNTWRLVATTTVSQAVLCCAVLCCAVLCCAVLCCAVLCHLRRTLPISLFASLCSRWLCYHHRLPHRVSCDTA